MAWDKPPIKLQDAMLKCWAERNCWYMNSMRATEEAKTLPDLMLQTQTFMRELERLIEALHRHWPIRKYVNPTNPPALRPLPASVETQKQSAKALRSLKNSAE